MTEEQTREVRIPIDLYSSISARIEGNGFNSVQDFVIYVLRVAMGKNEESTRTGDLTAEEAATVSARLKALGYI